MLRIVALLYAGASGPEALRSFERRALPLVKEHGGRLLLAFAPEDRAAGAPDEIHVLEFPSRAAFEGYRSDPRVLALAEQRAAAIARSEVYLAAEVIAYEADD